MKLWKQESNQQERHAVVEMKNQNQEYDNQQDLQTLSNEDSGEMQTVPLEDKAPEMPELENILLKESKTPWLTIFLLFIVLLVISTFSLLKGSNKGTSAAGVKSCGPMYWILIWGVFPLVIALTYWVGRHLIAENVTKQKLGYTFQEGDIRWTKKSTILISIVSVAAGILASLLGIGGGMVLSPLMLELKVLAQVTAATSSFMILFTSVSAIVQFLVLGKLLLDYGIWFAIVGFLSSFAGQTGINYLMKKYNKSSYIVFAIAAVIGVSTVLLVITGLMELVSNVKEGVSMGFHPLC